MQTIPAKTILQRLKDKSWFGQDYNMNIYKGCCHGCIYCDSRSACYRVDNFEIVKAKENALEILNKELARSIKTGVVGTGSMSDPYNPFEKKQNLTRNSLELLNAYGYGVSIATKSDLITRDIDILTDIKKLSPVISKITITTTNDNLAKKIEPFAPTSSARFKALAALSSAGIFCGILLMPVLPFIEDNEQNIIDIVAKGAASGIKFIYAGFGMTMRYGQREYFYSCLNEIFPDENYSQKYKNKYGDKYNCSSPHAKKLWDTFTTECNKYGILYNMRDIIAAYKQGYKSEQLSFL